MITFPTAKPSIFLGEISLNPVFQGITDEDLERKSVSAKLHLKKEKMKLEQLEQYRAKLFVRFELLTESSANKKISWLVQMTWIISNWRIRKTQEKIEDIDQRIKKHTETRIKPLLIEIRDLEEELHLRQVLKTPQTPETLLP